MSKRIKPEEGSSTMISLTGNQTKSSSCCKPSTPMRLP